MAFIFAIKSAPNASPDTSPATMPMVKGLSVGKADKSKGGMVCVMMSRGFVNDF
ncbi:hypothetical protein [Moraxella lacunata]|uniref:hypothetical protein n=1 Tax=Moraxella lacunata TaxID=477 RepID=UPI003EE15E2D